MGRPRLICTSLSRKEKDCADPAPEAAMLLELEGVAHHGDAPTRASVVLRKSQRRVEAGVFEEVQAPFESKHILHAEHEARPGLDRKAQSHGFSFRVG